MHLLIAALVSMPLFSTFFQGEALEKVIGCFTLQEGYCAVVSQTTGWGGDPQTVLRYLDENGMPSGSIQIENGGEPLSACAFQNGVAVFCIDSPGTLSRLIFVDGEEGWAAEFQGEFLGGGVVKPGDEGLFLAGNDLAGESPVRLAAVDPQGAVTMDSEYQEFQLDVADMAVRGGDVSVLGGREQPAWNHDFAVVFPLSGEEFNYAPGPGRFIPAGIIPAGQGYYLLSNAITDGNDLVGSVQVIKTTDDMGVEWTASLSGESWINAAGLALTGEGIAVAGWSNSLPFSEVNRSDLILCEFSEEGQLLWSVLHGGDNPDYGLQIGGCPDGGLLVSGCTVGDLYDGWVLRVDSTGSQEPQGINGEEPVPLHAVSVLASPSSNGSIRVTLQGFRELPETVRLLDMAGRTVEEKTYSGGILEFSRLPAGVYTVFAQDGEASVSARAVVTGGL